MRGEWIIDSLGLHPHGVASFRIADPASRNILDIYNHNAHPLLQLSPTYATFCQLLLQEKRGCHVVAKLVADHCITYHQLDDRHA